MIRKYNNSWYLFRRISNGKLKLKGKRNKSLRNNYLVKGGSSASGRLHLGTITFPERFVGKWIRFKVEPIEELETKDEDFEKYMSTYKKNKLKELYEKCDWIFKELITLEEFINKIESVWR